MSVLDGDRLIYALDNQHLEEGEDTRNISILNDHTFDGKHARLRVADTHRARIVGWMALGKDALLGARKDNWRLESEERVRAQSDLGVSST